MQYLQRLRNIREDKGITQKQIADLIGTTQSYYAQYEGGYRDIPFHRMITICRYLNISLDYIAGYTDDIKRIK